MHLGKVANNEAAVGESSERPDFAADLVLEHSETGTSQNIPHSAYELQG